MTGLLGLIGKLVRSAGSSAIGTATVLGVAGAMQPGAEGGPQLQGATLQNPVFEVNEYESRSLFGFQADGGMMFFLIGGGALILTILAAFICSGWGCKACRELSKRRAKQKGVKEEKLEQIENREIVPTDKDLESAMSRLRTKLGRTERKGSERGGGRDVFTDGLEF